MAEENYLKSVYHLQQQSSIVNTNALAQHLDTKPSSVTDMLKKLHSKKLLNYEPYKGFYLNKEGAKAALATIRKHRLWEFFLVNKLDFGWDEVHEVAEQLEHINSKKLIDKLDAFLEYPGFDPHGDPIPDSNGKITYQDQIKLSELKINQPATVSSVANQSAELFDFLKMKFIQIGTILEVKAKTSFDNSLEIKIKNHSSVHISEQVANLLHVKII